MVFSFTSQRIVKHVAVPGRNHSIAYFARIAAFEALYRGASVKGGLIRAR